MKTTKLDLWKCYMNQSRLKPKWNSSAKINPTNLIHSFIHQTQIEQHLFVTILGIVGDLQSLHHHIPWQNVKSASGRHKDSSLLPLRSPLQRF